MVIAASIAMPLFNWNADIISTENPAIRINDVTHMAVPTVA